MPFFRAVWHESPKTLEHSVRISLSFVSSSNDSLAGLYGGHLSGYFMVCSWVCTDALATPLLSVLHRLDIVHTDLKPENIVLVDDTIVTVRDIDGEGHCYDKVS